MRMYWPAVPLLVNVEDDVHDQPPAVGLLAAMNVGAVEVEPLSVPTGRPETDDVMTVDAAPSLTMRIALILV